MTREIIDRASTNLAGVPELQDAFTLLNEQPRLIHRTFLLYRGLVNQLCHLTPQDLIVIANARRDLQKDGASRYSATDFYRLPYEERMRALRAVDDVMLTQTEGFPGAGMQALRSMMEAGHMRSQAGDSPVDGDPSWDVVIWGHTQGIRPLPMVHFTIAHYFERTVTAALAHIPEQSDAPPRRKDWFLASLTDTLLATRDRNPRFDDIVRIWEAPRSRSEDEIATLTTVERENLTYGLEWLSATKIAAYQANSAS